MAEPKKVLVIDDERALAELLQVNLELEGFVVSKAYSGIEGLNKLPTEKPDIIMLDVRMPGLDGFEICRRLKADPATKDIPVIMLSAFAQQTDIQKGMDAGATDYVKKPFDVVKVVDLIKKILHVA